MQVTSEVTSNDLGAPSSTIHVLDLRNRMSAASVTLQVGVGELIPLPNHSGPRPLKTL